MKSKLLKKVLSCALVMTLMSASLTVGATGTIPAPAPGGSSGSSSGSTSPADSQTSDAVLINGKEIVSTVGGQFHAKNVDGVAVTTPLANVNAAMGLAAGEKAQVRVYKSACGKLAQACIENAATALGVPVGPALDIFAGKVADGKYSNIDKLTTPVRFSVGIPAEFKDGTSEYAVIRVQPGGAVTVLVDLDNDPNTVTFDTTGFGVFAIVKAAPGGFVAFR